MEKVTLERNIFDLAKPLLREIYGEYNVNLGQIDKPDAAIEVLGKKFRVGLRLRQLTMKKYFNI